MVVIFDNAKKFFFSIRQDKQLSIILICFIVYSITFSFLSVSRYNAFYATNDLGIFNQKLYNTLHGRFFLSAEGGMESYQHMDYLILALLPVYVLFPRPETLLVIQSLVLASASIPLFFLAKEKIKSKHIPLILSITFLLYPALHFVNFYDYHSIILAVPLLISGFYFFEKKQYNWSLFAFSLAMFAKETVSMFIILTGILLFLRTRMKETLYLIGIASIWFIFSMYILMPSSLVAGSSFFDTYSDRYNHLGNNEMQVVGKVLTDPLYALTYGGVEKRTEFIYDIFAPIGFVALLDPVILLSSPQFVAALFSKYDWMRSMEWQSYTAIIIPFVFISLIYSVRRLGVFLGRYSKNSFLFVSLFVLFCCILSFFTIGFGTDKNYSFVLRSITPESRLTNNVDLVVSMVPENATLSTTHRIFSHVWGKKMIYRLQDNIEQILYEDGYDNLPDYIIIDFEDDFYKFDLRENEMTEQLTSRGYKVRYNTSGIFLYGR